ncbi:esterase/lipase family protein [Marinobacter sp. SS21]|uniref:esterase/lipase family protein n=1 Tax=Marinobacter sp. SS21 TaxID=2979460 RepID=UPI00232D88D7|nr:acetyltransferase [Marinobacter sp. SS21]MDC0661490.1 acetyltransferase [Marinobacter sp. SS21]
MPQRIANVLLGATLAFGISQAALAGSASKTQHPIVFAHGMAGFDNILGYDYWGDDYGVFVLDPCDSLFELTCNADIDANQQSYISSVTPFESSEVRGAQLADNIESYMASTGATHINVVGHSQGGIDMRKAARLLHERKGYRVVQSMISLSSPHRGSPTAKELLDNYRYQLVEMLANYYGNVVYGAGNDAIAGAKQLVFDDYEDDGVITGMKAFNEKYPASTTYAKDIASLLTAQNGLSVNPALWLVSNGIHDIDGDGYCNDDCNGDGAAGQGDGNPGNRDDDGLVGINSQQMGHRLDYEEAFGYLDQVHLRTDHGYVDNLNHLSQPEQMTSLQYVINQDHLDVIGVGPDTFDEMEFYAAITDYIADQGN